MEQRGEATLEVMVSSAMAEAHLDQVAHLVMVMEVHPETEGTRV